MKQSYTPELVIGFKRRRIRIPKPALRLIGSPHYVRLLIDPEERYIAVIPGKEGESMSHRVPDKIYHSHCSYEICSMTLMEQLLSYCCFPAGTASCSLKAKACIDGTMVVFSFPEIDSHEQGR